MAAPAPLCDTVDGVPVGALVDVTLVVLADGWVELGPAVVEFAAPVALGEAVVDDVVGLGVSETSVPLALYLAAHATRSMPLGQQKVVLVVSWVQ